MFTLCPVRNFSKLAVILERSSGILTIVNSRRISALHTNTGRPFEYVKPKLQNPNILVSRYMAKGKEKLKKGQAKVKIDEHELSKYFDYGEVTADFARTLDNFKKVLVEQASLRTSPSSIEQMKIKYNGDTYMIQDLAEVGKKGGKEIILEMSAFIDAVPVVLEALKKSPLGLNPNQEGSAIIVPIPRVTRQHREALAKGAKALFNKCKENVRNVQHKYIKKTDEIQGVSDDITFRLKAQFTALGNKCIDEAEEMLKVKEKELLSTE